MGDRLAFLTTILQTYEARESGDLDALLSHMHPNIQFKIAGDANRCGACMTFDGRDAAMGGIARLIETFTFEALDMLDSVVEGSKAAVHWKATVTHRPTGEVFQSEMLDIWTVSPEGLVTGITQFCDTALLNHFLAEN